MAIAGLDCLAERVEIIEGPALSLEESLEFDAQLFSCRKEALRVYQWKGHGISFGYFLDYNQVVSWNTRGLPMARRSTGGGIVEHGEDVGLSYIFPWYSGWTPLEVYRRIHERLAVLLRTIGAAVEVYRGSINRGAVCFSGPTRYDLVADGKKVLGGALRRSGGWGLYQGSLQAKSLGVSFEEIKQAAQQWKKEE